MTLYTGYLTKSKERSLIYYLPLAGGRRDGSMHFPKVWAWTKTQMDSFRIWIQVADSQLQVKTVLFQTIYFNISILFSYIWSIDRILSGAPTPGQSGPWSDGNEGVLRVPQSSRITVASPSELVSYPGHPLVGALSLCRKAVGVFNSPSRLSKLS